MHLDLTSPVAVAALIVGALALWSNPRRAINRVFFSLSVHEALWLLSLHLAIISADGLRWLRIATAVGAFLPVHLWCVKESIVLEGRFRGMMLGGWWRFCLSALLAALCFTPWFIPNFSTRAHPVYGAGYYLYTAGIMLSYAWVTLEATLQLRRQTGVRRIELQSLLLAGGAAALAVVALMGLSSLLRIPWLIRLQPLVILFFHTGTVISITTYRIFDARQVLVFALQKFSLVGLVGGEAYLANGLFELFLPKPFALLATTAISLWFAFAFNDLLNRKFRFYPQAVRARQAAFDAARTETRAEPLEAAFVTILKGWGQAEHAVVLSGGQGALHGGGLELSEGDPAVRALRQLRWATPESLDRGKATPERAILSQFFRTHRLGVVALVDGPSLSVLVGVGVAVSRQPFTYPQVTQLLELASIIEGALERAHLSAKAQRAEQLATVGLVGASFAHEIRNPLVSIKTFVQLLPKHYGDPAFRDKFFRLIGDEVTRIDRLTEQLLDLAAPRAYLPQLIELHPLLRSSLDLAAAKAGDKKIQILTELQASPDVVHTDPSAAKQVLLNLCFNAIQAVEDRVGDRWIKIATNNRPGGLEMTVTDNGPGINPEIRPRLFQPFQTTKSSGFGLGLATCVDILSSLHATLTVDPPVAGEGATFRVIFPCRP